ncbi:DNA topoisomerase IV, partial [Micrococcus luteus]
GQAGADLMVPDTACWALLSTSGRLLRTADRTPIAPQGRRRKHDAFASVVPTTARGEIGALTSAGALHRLQAVDLPVAGEPSAAPAMTTALPAAELVPLAKGETLVALVPLDTVMALGTAHGVVKRVRPEWPLNRQVVDAVALKDGDAVVGAAPAPDEADQLVFLTRTGQLLRYAASAVRPQGPAGGGVAG